MALHCISSSATCLSASHAHRRGKMGEIRNSMSPAACQIPGGNRRLCPRRRPAEPRCRHGPWAPLTAGRRQVAGARMVPDGSMHKVTMSLLGYPDIDRIDDSIFSRVIGPF
ncbi:hypothetical protein PAHAL_9G031500 [Panicum hallii]|uniref:Uncharacterized protein n=1 Tax=Panicum hallii TaxID=206008 RepID=A0A2T8HZY4_9POAL|nr:hypothetical protein PAHAL_9G031500 [Panicum hallii]